jgi:hypothetical protein
MSIRAEFKEEKNSDFEDYISDYWMSDVLTTDIFNNEITGAYKDFNKHRASDRNGEFTFFPASQHIDARHQLLSPFVLWRGSGTNATRLSEMIPTASLNYLNYLQNYYSNNNSNNPNNNDNKSDESDVDELPGLESISPPVICTPEQRITQSVGRIHRSIDDNYSSLENLPSLVDQSETPMWYVD